MNVRDWQLNAEQQKNIEQLGHPISGRAEFLSDLRAALEQRRPFAVGRIGMSQKHWMYYPILLRRGAANPKVYQLFERRLKQHGLKHEGVFPDSPDFYLRFNEFYITHVRNLDYLGLYLNDWDVVLEKPILDFYHLQNKFINYIDVQPDRSLRGDESNCYLAAFRNKKVLIVCPFASLLARRANRTTFEGVWSKISKPWFYPQSVAALDIPYGFAADTHSRYATAFEMYDDIVQTLAGQDFDIALLGAGGLAIPLASHIKSTGRIALDIGGHLQMVFGVIGKKWRNLPDWRAAYYNEWWIDMPPQYKPKENDVCPENGEPGAFW